MNSRRAWWLVALAGVACATGECEPRCNPTLSCTYQHHVPLPDAGPPPVRTQVLPCSADGSCRIVQLAAGGFHACALRDDGRVLCWGAGANGQTGRPPRSPPTGSGDSPAVVGGIDAVVEVATGVEHTCARRETGEVLCWGADGGGQLGDGEDPSPSRGTPALVVGLPAADGLSLGSRHSCARTGGLIRCWGQALFGELTAEPLLPAALPGVFDAVAVASTWSAACAPRTEGGVVCAGSEWLGDGREFPHLRSEGVSVAGLGDAVAIAAGPAHFCALRSTSEVTCWGRNGQGQLGDGTRETRMAPVAVVDLAGITITAITASGRGPDATEDAAHTCALDDAGVVRCWGSNDDGQLGDGSRERRVRPVVAHLAGTERIVEVSAGGGYTCVRTESGLVRCFGLRQPGFELEPVSDDAGP